MNTNKENESLNQTRLLLKKNNTKQYVLKDDEEFHQYVNKGQRMIQILRERLIETSNGKFIVNSNLISKLQGKENGRSNSGPKTVITKTRSLYNKTSRGDYSKYVFETMFSCKFNYHYKKNTNQSLITTRENTSRTRNQKRNSITFACNQSDISHNDQPLIINNDEKHHSKCRSISRIKPIPFNLLIKKSSNNQSALSIFTNYCKKEPVSVLYKDTKK